MRRDETRRVEKVSASEAFVTSEHQPRRRKKHTNEPGDLEYLNPTNSNLITRHPNREKIPTGMLHQPETNTTETCKRRNKQRKFAEHTDECSLGVAKGQGLTTTPVAIMTKDPRMTSIQRSAIDIDARSIPAATEFCAMAKNRRTPPRQVNNLLVWRVCSAFQRSIRAVGWIAISLHGICPSPLKLRKRRRWPRL